MSLTVRTTLVLLALTAAAFAQPRPPEPRRSVRAAGEATVTASPDRATIDIGVVSQAPAAQAAAAQNAKQLDAVLKELKQLIGKAGTINTISYSIHPDYRHPRDGGKPTIAGYTATNIIQVKLDDLELTGKVVDAATRTGANTIQRLEFTLKNDREVRNQALREAAQQARASAEAIAAGLGVKVTGVISAEQGVASVIPLRDMAMARMAAEASTPTPIEPGTIHIRATVTLTLEIAP